MKKPNAKILRGLKWIYTHAEADLETVAGQKDHFPTESEADVEAALEWLRAVLPPAHSRSKT